MCNVTPQNKIKYSCLKKDLAATKQWKQAHNFWQEACTVPCASPNPRSEGTAKPEVASMQGPGTHFCVEKQGGSRHVFSDLALEVTHHRFLLATQISPTKHRKKLQRSKSTRKQRWQGPSQRLAPKDAVCVLVLLWHCRYFCFHTASYLLESELMARSISCLKW